MDKANKLQISLKWQGKHKYYGKAVASRPKKSLPPSLRGGRRRSEISIFSSKGSCLCAWPGVRTLVIAAIRCVKDNNEKNTKTYEQEMARRRRELALLSMVERVLHKERPCLVRLSSVVAPYHRLSQSQLSTARTEGVAPLPTMWERALTSGVPLSCQPRAELSSSPSDPRLRGRRPSAHRRMRERL